jgi:hypothetical protein
VKQYGPDDSEIKQLQDMYAKIFPPDDYKDIMEMLARNLDKK